jgi:HK97 family phage portal protein
MNVFDAKKLTPDFWNVINRYDYKRVTADEIVKEGFLGNELVYACVSSLARACASTPIKLMNGEDVVQANDPVFNMFYDNWNSKQGKNEAMYQLFINLFLHGKAYTLKKSEMVGFETNELWVLPTQAVEPSQENVSYFESTPYYKFTDQTTIHKYFTEELIILEYYDPSTLDDNQSGLSPLQSVWNTIGASNNRAIAEKAMLKNRGISGLISPKATSGDAGALGFSNSVMEVVRKAFVGITGGAEKFNKVEVVEQAVDFTQLGMDAGDMKTIEMQLPHVRSICRALNLPSQLFGDYQSNTYSNYKEANKAFYTNAVIPNVKHFINQFEKDLFNNINALTGQSYYLEISVEEIPQLKTDQDKLRTSVLAQLEKNLITKKEARETLGLSAEMEEESLQGFELLRSVSPLLANNIFNGLNEEDKAKILKEIGLI